MNTFQRFVPLTKVDKSKHMVYGWATTPDLDSDGEIVSLAGIEKALPEYMKFPTIREMHQPIAAGTTVHADVRKGKGQQGLWIGAKIVGKDAWEKVEQGVYRGFSIGGDVIQKVGNMIKDLSLVEISLVDVPANKTAKIELWKSETYWKRDFSDSQRKRLATTGAALPDGSFPIVTVQDLKNAIRAIGRAKDPAAARAHIKRRARALGQSALIPKDWGKVVDISLEKNAHSMSAYGGLLSHAQEVANHLASHGKNTKKVDQMVEHIKQLISKEADEPEEPRSASGKNMPGDGMMGGIAFAAGLTQRATALEKMEFETEAEKLIAKEVINVLKKKAKELNEEEELDENGKPLKKTDTRGGKHAPADARDGEDLPNVDDAEDLDEDPDEKDDDEEEAEDQEEEDAENPDQKKEDREEARNGRKGDIPSLTKISKSLAKLEKMNPSKVEKQRLGLEKAVGALADGFEKMVSAMEVMKQEIELLKKQPAALKSKSVAVFRNDADKEAMTKSEKEKSEKSATLELKKARMAELEKQYNTLGRAEYGRQGLGIEASTLQDEIARLESEVEA